MFFGNYFVGIIFLFIFFIIFLLFFAYLDYVFEKSDNNRANESQDGDMEEDIEPLKLKVLSRIGLKRNIIKALVVSLILYLLLFTPLYQEILDSIKREANHMYLGEIRQ